MSDHIKETCNECRCFSNARTESPESLSGMGECNNFIFKQDLQVPDDFILYTYPWKLNCRYWMPPIR